MQDGNSDILDLHSIVEAGIARELANGWSVLGFHMDARTTVQRVYNFSAGPAVLPVPVLEEVQRDLVALPGVGMSVLEISHRSETFEAILAQAEADIRALGGMPATTRCCSCRAAPACSSRWCR